MLTKNQKKIPPKATHKKPTAQLPARSVSFFSANKLLAILHADNKNESENFQSEGSASSPASFQTNPKEENQTRLNNLSSHENYSSPLSVQPVITSRIEVSQASSESNRENQVFVCEIFIVTILMIRQSMLPLNLIPIKKHRNQIFQAIKLSSLLAGDPRFLYLVLLL